MSKTAVTAGAKVSGSPYSPGIITGNMVFVSGQVPMNAETKEIVRDDFEGAVRQCIENVERILNLGVRRHLVEIAAAVARSHEVEAERVDPGFLQGARCLHEEPPAFRFRAGESVTENNEALAGRAMKDRGEMSMRSAQNKRRFSKGSFHSISRPADKFTLATRTIIA